MLRIAVVEDSQQDRERIQSFLSRYSLEKGVSIEITTFFDGMSFLDEYRADFDIVLLDIEMPHMDGMTAAKRLREVDESVCLIFVTNMAQYAIEGYEVNARDFLLKPLNYGHFVLRLEKAIWNCQMRKESFCTLKTAEGGGSSALPPDLLCGE